MLGLYDIAENSTNENSINENSINEINNLDKIDTKKVEIYTDADNDDENWTAVKSKKQIKGEKITDKDFKWPSCIDLNNVTTRKRNNPNRAPIHL